MNVIERDASLLHSVLMRSAFLLLICACLPLNAYTGRVCEADDDFHRCWYIIWGYGEGTNQEIFIADSKNRRLSSNDAQIEVIRIWEAKDKPDYAVYKLDFRCGEKKVRLHSAYAALKGGRKILRISEPDQWKDIPEPWIDRAFLVACVDETLADPESNRIYFLSGTLRPVDLVPLVRRDEFQQEGGRE